MIEGKFQFSLISINKFKILWSKIWKIYDTQTSKVCFVQTKLVMKYESFSMSHIVRVINLFLLIHVSGQIVKFTKRFLTMFALEVRCSLDNRIQQFLIVSRIINRLLLSIQLLATWGIWNQVVINGQMVKKGWKMMLKPKQKELLQCYTTDDDDKKVNLSKITSFCRRTWCSLWLWCSDCILFWFLYNPSISFCFAQLSPSCWFISTLLHFLIPVAVSVSLKMSG